MEGSSPGAVGYSGPDPCVMRVYSACESVLGEEGTQVAVIRSLAVLSPGHLAVSVVLEKQLAFLSLRYVTLISSLPLCHLTPTMCSVAPESASLPDPLTSALKTTQRTIDRGIESNVG